MRIRSSRWYWTVAPSAGFDHANFFGYIVRHNCYQLSNSRKEGVMAIQFPRNLKMMQSFLGEALFFKSFVPDYSELTAPLHDMTRRKDFDWSDKSTWKQDYEAVFVESKKALCNALSLYYPEYDWTWILRVDASDIACGAILSTYFMEEVLQKVPARLVRILFLLEVVEDLI